jgi:hypothetical protein
LSPEDEALRAVVDRLEGLGIPYMVTGSMASSHHGHPRSTHDIDVVIDPTPAGLEGLVSGLTAAGFFVDEERARDALRRRRVFNAIEECSGTKIDLVIRKERPFSVEELRRRTRAVLRSGVKAAIVTAEDSVLSKLEWAKASGGSERQIGDVIGVLKVQGDRLDESYVERWARELGVEDLWRTVKESREGDPRP